LTRLRALLANEAGGGRGHVTTLAAAAQALGPNVTCIAAIGRQIYAQDLTRLGLPVRKAPLLARDTSLPQTFALRGSATWGDTLAEIGLDDPQKLRRGLQFWRQLIIEQDISLLVADFAPLALRAALGLRDEGWAMRIVSLGTGYTSPPAGLEQFPIYLADHAQITRSEAATLARLNQIGAETRLDPLPRLSALYDVDLTLATTFAFLDPYASRPEADRMAPLSTASRHLANGTGMFVYFSTAELTDPALVDALASLPQPRRGYLPSAPPEVRDRLAASGMELLDQPASPDEIAAYARLIIHAAPHGTLCMAALAGLGQFGIPQHLEQFFNARHAAAQGILRIGTRGAPDLAAQIAAAYADRGFHDQCRAVAADLRQTHPSDPIAALATRLRPEIDAAHKASG
jgi:hypothetical protein